MTKKIFYHQDIMMNGEQKKEPIFLQIVFIDQKDQILEVQFSDTINLTPKMKLNVKHVVKNLELYAIAKLKYKIMPIDETNVDKYER